MNSIDETIKLYETVGWKKWFSRIRFWDAPYVEVEKLIPKTGLIYEFGCGEGIFSNFMAVSSSKRKVFGIELDKDRIQEAERGVKNASFEYGDALKFKASKLDGVVMFHLLHHLTSHKKQEELLNKSYKALKKNGKLIIVEIDRKPFIKYLICWFTDHFLVAWLFENKIYEDKIFFRPSDKWKKLLVDIGFNCKVIPASKNKPFSHVIFYCIKK